MIGLLLYILMAIASFFGFLWINKNYLEWITTDESQDESNLKLAIAAVGSILWPAGIPIFLICLGVRYIRENFLP